MGLPTRRLLISLIAWTALVVVALLVWPGNINTPGCARLVQASSACLDQLATYNERMWWTDTFPRLLVLASGYVVIGTAALRHWIRSRRVGR